MWGRVQNHNPSPIGPALGALLVDQPLGLKKLGISGRRADYCAAGSGPLRLGAREKNGRGRK